MFPPDGSDFYFLLKKCTVVWFSISWSDKSGEHVDGGTSRFDNGVI
jgi:hypothetical protein